MPDLFQDNLERRGVNDPTRRWPSLHVSRFSQSHIAGASTVWIPLLRHPSVYAGTGEEQTAEGWLGL